MDKRVDGIVRQLKRFVYAQRAFKGVIAMSQHLRSFPNPEEIKWYSVAICGICTEYMRPFQSAGGLGPLPKQFEEFDDVSMRELHEDLKNGRHWVFAHHDAVNARQLLSDEEAALHGRVKVRSEGKHSYVLSTRLMGLSSKQLPAIESLCQLQHSRINSAMIKPLRELTGGAQYPRGEYILGENFP